jgi:hypothetical protein
MKFRISLNMPRLSNKKSAGKRRYSSLNLPRDEYNQKFQKRCSVLKKNHENESNVVLGTAYLKNLTFWHKENGLEKLLRIEDIR